LLKVNKIQDPTTIPVHTKIFIPGARRILDLGPREAFLAWPLRGRITTPFNEDGDGRHHEGIDIDGEMGQPIRAAADGRVIEARQDGKYGNSIRIDHGDQLTTFYAHASKLLVGEGDWVRRGEVIAEVGCSGNARGTHLHFETRRDGNAVNPLSLLNARDVAQAANR
jgi:murein DD-endopeptidase MepM/ murein hydrolase activator NlpD